MMKLEGKKAHTRFVHIGEPHRPDSPFYPTALEFRHVLDRLGLPMTRTVREFVESSVPVLKKLESARSPGSEIRLITLIEVVHPDGSSEIVGDRIAGLRVERVEPSRKRVGGTK